METIDHDALVAMLDRLLLTAIRDQLDTLLDEAARSDMTLREALDFLVSREIARRDERIEMATKLAQFPFVRELDGFEWAAQPSVDQRQIRELATCRCIAHSDALLFLGPPGTVKTHLAVSLGCEAIRHNCSVQFVTAATLVAALAKAHGDGRLDEQLTIYARPMQLIIDELGYLPFEPNAAHLFFQLASRRYSATAERAPRVNLPQIVSSTPVHRPAAEKVSSPLDRTGRHFLRATRLERGSA